MSSYLPDDIIAGVLNFFPEDIRYVTGDRVKVHQTISELEKEGYSLLEPFVFSTKGISPVSQVLEGTLARLLLARIISYDNPDYYRFEIRPIARKYITANILPKFSPEEKAQLKEIAAKLAERCGERDEERTGVL